MRVDYHVHTCYSFDSSAALEEVAARASASGLDRICVTDHETLEGALRLADMHLDDLDVVIGCELTAADGSQVIGLRLREVVLGATVFDLAEGIKRQGGQVLLPHPFRRRSGVLRKEVKRPAGFVDDILELTDLIECFNGRDSYQANTASYRFIVERGLAAVAGSDAHAAGDIGSVFVEYPDPDPTPGVSACSIFFPDQRPSIELARPKELFHRLPSPVQHAFRRARQGAGLERPSGAPGEPRLQYEMPMRRGDVREVG